MLRNYPLKTLNTWNVGGSCSLYSAPLSALEARDAVASSINGGEKLYILGGGSNILVGDGELSAVVLHTNRLDDIKISNPASGNGVLIETGAGYPVKKLLALAIENSWGGLEFLTGIPGTVGGALWGNAGARGEGFAPLVESVETVDTGGNIRMWNANGLDWKYRECPFSADKGVVLITRCFLRLSAAPKSAIIERIGYFASLKKNQPLGRKTAGCVFKNPDGDSAGRLLDAAGCKGLRVGGAIVSPNHANFIENNGGATSGDIFSLCEKCRERVFLYCGVRLEYEIHFFGTFKTD